MGWLSEARRARRFVCNWKGAMNTVKVCYTDAKNLGDAINPLIIRNVFGLEPIRTHAWNCEVTGIGSGLRRFFVDERKMGGAFRIKHALLNMANPQPVVIWSAGFLSTPSNRMVSVRKECEFASVRGLLSKAALEAALGKTLESCLVGDAGILASQLIGQQATKTTRVGILPHRSEKDSPVVAALCSRIPQSAVIDIECDDPMVTLNSIASCECILSSSLHGLIFADSFRVPNKHILISNSLAGDGFKFKDYYSAFELYDCPLDARFIEPNDIDSIIDSYPITDEQVMRLQEDCKDAFLKHFG